MRNTQPSEKGEHAALRKSVCFGLHVHARVSISVFPRRLGRTAAHAQSTRKRKKRGVGEGGRKLAGMKQDAGTEALLLSRLSLIPTEGVRHVHLSAFRFFSWSLMFLLSSLKTFSFLRHGFALMSFSIIICKLSFFSNPYFLFKNFIWEIVMETK